MKIRARICISGRVQGVFFRMEIHNKALKRNVTGWVRNTNKGRVEAIFEGEEADVEQLVNFCRRGPPAARVTKIEVQWEDFTGEFKVFKILRSVSF